MWDYFYARRIYDLYNQPLDMINSPFAFPRIPSNANPPLGISNIGKVKDSIIDDKNAIMGKLFEHHEMFQRQASGLFNFSSNRFTPGHPMNKVQKLETPKDEKETMRKENPLFKNPQLKEKK